MGHTVWAIAEGFIKDNKYNIKRFVTVVPVV